MSASSDIGDSSMMPYEHLRGEREREREESEREREALREGGESEKGKK